MIKQTITADERRRLDEKKPELIRLVKKILDEADNEIPKKRQYTGLVQAAEQATCVEELELLIRYKSVKDGTKQDWEKLAKPLADAIANEDGELMGFAKEVAESNGGERTDLYHMELVKKFLGYLMWYGCVKTEKRKRR